MDMVGHSEAQGPELAVAEPLGPKLAPLVPCAVFSKE